MSRHDEPLIYAHVGDLHLTTEFEQNHVDFAAIVDELAGSLREAFDFVYLPGDNADNGAPEQYALLARQLARLPMPVYVVTGDHDMEPGSLDAFHAELDVPQLPNAIDASGVRCLFLDICGPGSGGPDFRIGDDQTEWLTRELRKAAGVGQGVAVFMHTYPADLKGDGETATVNAALIAPEVLLVDMGHAHYNELANDGRTIFAATRSTGQIEEGPVGYSIATIDGRVVSWRFRELGAPLPVVLITSPADRRLATDPDDPSHRPIKTCEVRASVIGPSPIVNCTCTIGSASPVPMASIGEGRFALSTPLHDDGSRIMVEASDADGNVGREAIEFARSRHFDVSHVADGSDADAVEAWPERGLLGTQLGPNRNGRKW